MQTQSKGLAVITGASSGIGAVYADRLSRRGYDLLLVARSRGPMDGLAKKLAASTGRKIDILAADLTDAKDLAGLERFLRQNSNVTLLVNNAGLGATKALLNSDVSDMSRIIALNVEALTRLTYAVVPEFVKRGSGTIINIGSVVGVAPEILNGVYGGTKAYVLAFSQSLRHELADKGIAVQVVLPGATATDFWGTAGKPVGGRVTRRARSRRIRDDSGAPRRRTLAELRGGTPGTEPLSVLCRASLQIRGRSRNVSSKC